MLCRYVIGFIYMNIIHTYIYLYSRCHGRPQTAGGEEARLEAKKKARCKAGEVAEIAFYCLLRSRFPIKGSVLGAERKRCKPEIWSLVQKRQSSSWIHAGAFAVHIMCQMQTGQRLARPCGVYKWHHVYLWKRCRKPWWLLTPLRWPC